MKNIFLFGAGASYGSGGLNYPIPLGMRLYWDLKNRFPNTWGELPENVSNKFEKNFEEGMGVIWEKYSDNISILMQDMAVFFSKIFIRNPENNLYVKIINSLKEKELLNECVISTLNYDCLIEIAISISKILVKYVPDETANTSLLILKLHGSCNFILDGIKARRNTKYWSGASFNGNGLKIVPLNEVEQYCRGDNALYPAMSIFMKDKPNQIGKPHIEAMQNKWKEWVVNAEKIFIIGVNPYLDDTHIWDALSNTKSKIYFCGDGNAFKNWQNIKFRTDVYIGSIFQDCFLDIIKYL